LILKRKSQEAYNSKTEAEGTSPETQHTRKKFNVKENNAISEILHVEQLKC
jgi:hypothetical protein